jgi:hypothetical protein
MWENKLKIGNILFHFLNFGKHFFPFSLFFGKSKHFRNFFYQDLLQFSNISPAIFTKCLYTFDLNSLTYGVEGEGLRPERGLVHSQRHLLLAEQGLRDVGEHHRLLLRL